MTNAVINTQADALDAKVDALKNSKRTIQSTVKTLTKKLRNFHTAQTRQTIQVAINRLLVQVAVLIETKLKMMQEKFLKRIF